MRANNRAMSRRPPPTTQKRNPARRFACLAIAGLAALLATNTAVAADPPPVKPVASALPYSYAPANCDFRIDFPSAPLRGKRCDPDDASRCNDVTTYTHVFALDATVDVTVTCNAAEPNMYEHYSGEVMRAALGGMVGKGKLDSFQTSYKQFDDAKQATLIGTGKQGVSDKIYIAQLWIGHKSVFTVEAQMLGQNNQDANDMFAGILKSIRYKDWHLTPPATPASSDKASTVPGTAAPAAATPAPAAAAVATPVAATPPPAGPTMIRMGDAANAPAFAPASTTLIVTPAAQMSPTAEPAK